MEGLLIAEQLRLLEPLLPAERRAWRFPDDRTAVLPLVGEVSIWLSSRPPTPRFEVRRGAPGEAAPKTPFQEQLVARASGALVGASQPALDRVVRFEFGPTSGFVPEPATRLVAELTGRNANLVLLAEDGTILGVERVVLAERNRYRELRPGLTYVPPPPYDKVDPLRAGDDQIRAALRGRRLSEVRDVVDGIGPRLMAALRGQLDRFGEGRLEGEFLAEAVKTVQRLAAEPSAALESFGEEPGAERHDEGRALAALRARVEAALRRRQRLTERRIADAEHALKAADEASELRAQGDLLLANAASYRADGERATLRGFDGTDVELIIDPRLDAAGNATARYERAKRREARANRAAAQLPELRREALVLQKALAELPGAAEGRLRELAEEFDVEQEPLRAGRSSRAASARRGAGAGDRHPGVRFVDPRGYEIYVGRSAKENDAITFKLARSRDLWLHAQGYRGAHVVVRSQGRELPFDTVLFAARLAAGFSQAKDSDNVAVDYTLRKNVWRPKGAPPGAVNFAHHKTVYVTPARDDLAARGEAGSG